MLITMPQLGETVTEGTIVRWCKAVGDAVERDEPLFEVSTDKVDTEVPAEVAGTITEILVPEGATVAIGAPLARVATDADTDTNTDTGTAADAPASAPTLVADATTVPVEAAPAARAAVRVAPGARITRDHVEARLVARARPLTLDTPATAPAVDADGPAAEPPPGTTLEPITPIRRRIATHMRASIETAAHTLVVMQADYSAVEAARAVAPEEFRAREGFGLTALPFVARAVVDAIRAWPRVNATLGPDALAVHRDVHLGIAVDLDHEGLVVPVVRDADRLRLVALARAIHDHGVAARARTLAADDLAGGTFTITNAGGYGTLMTAPIINQPQVAIISTDSVAMRPVAIPLPDGTHGIAVRPVGNLSLSFDHRAFDGAYASAFLARVVELVATRAWSEELA